MKIMVCIKQVPHQDARLDVNSSGDWIQEDNIKFEINQYDQHALEAALAIKDAGEADVIVVSIGPDRVTQALRTGLGMGADRAVHINDDEALSSDSLGIAKVLAAVAKEENPDMVFLGLMADDGNYAAVGPMLAELMGVAHTTTAVKIDQNGNTLTVERELEGGALEVVEISSPCVVSVQTGINQVRYASLKGIMAAKKKPIDTKSGADLGLAGQLAAKAQIEKIYIPPKGEGADLIEGSADEVAAALVGKIKELGLL